MSVRMREPEQIIEMDSHRIAYTGCAVSLVCDPLRFVKDVRVVPINEDIADIFLHSIRSPVTAGETYRHIETLNAAGKG